MRAKMYNYVYLITNKINDKQYIGDHSTNNLSDKYMGSGILLKEDKKIFGIENFDRKILEFFITKKDAYEGQRKYIKLYSTHISLGGYNKNWTGGQWASIVSKETRKKISKKMLGRTFSEETKKKMSNSRKGIQFSDKTKKLMSKTRKEKGLAKGKNNGMFEKTHTKKTKLQISKSRIERGSAAGKNNPTFDHTIYNFFNIKSKKKFVGYKFDLAQKINSGSSALNAVIKGGRRTHHKNWTLA